MRNFLSLVALVLCLSGCAGKIEFVPPPITDPPLLKSSKVDLNDTTKEEGVWMDWPDYKAVMGQFEHDRNLKKIWK